MDGQAIRDYLPCTLRRTGLLLVSTLLFAVTGVAFAQDKAAVAVSSKALAQLLQSTPMRAAAVVVPRQNSQLSAETTASVAATPVDVGERVQAGAVLVRLDPKDAQLRVAAARAALAAAQAGLDLAKVRLERAAQMAERNFVSADELKERQALNAQETANLALRRSELDLAQRDLQRCTILAPFAGWVTLRIAQVGQLATPGTPLLQLVEDAPTEISAQLDPTAVVDLNADSAVFFVNELQQRLPLTWLRTSAVIDSSSRQIEVRFAFADETARAGSSGRVEWQSGGGRLPAMYQVRRSGQLGLFIAEAGRARFHPLPAADAGRPVRVDLPAQTQVIVDGQERLQDGDRISLIP